MKMKKSDGRTVAKKMSIKANSRTIFVNADNKALDNIHLPVLNISKKLEEEFDYIHLFVKTQNEFNYHFPKLKEYLKSNGMM